MTCCMSVVVTVLLLLLMVVLVPFQLLLVGVYPLINGAVQGQIGADLLWPQLTAGEWVPPAGSSGSSVVN